MRANSKRHFSLFSGPLNSFVKKAAPKIVVLPGRAMQTAALHDFYKELVSLAKTRLFPPNVNKFFLLPSVRKENFIPIFTIFFFSSPWCQIRYLLVTSMSRKCFDSVLEVIY